MNQFETRMKAALESGGISSSAIYRTALAAASAAISAPVTVLDHGSGIGGLLKLLREVFPGAALHATDIMERPEGLSADVTWHRSDLNNDTPIADETFDLICAIEVIEHLENPRHMLREIARMLKPGGFAVVSTPNTCSIKSIMTFAAHGHHAQFDDENYPAHIMPVSAVDIERISAENGLVRQCFFYTDSGTIPKLLHTRWQELPVIGRYFKGQRFSDNYGAVLHKPVKLADAVS
jgi:2-polyprenyl-3-methyl-5-hydroxy-6-metoxy-1,4-benzoquinol methylase